MQRKPGFPVANCNIKMPDTIQLQESIVCDEDKNQQQRRQQLINFGHSQWGFNNWSWSVTKQDLDFVDFANGKYCAGVVAFVSVTVKSFDIHRDNIGYATSVAPMKGLAIHQSRRCAVTNALRETLLSFGGGVTTELLELLETHKSEVPNHNVAPANEPMHENNQNIPNRLVEPKNAPLIKNIRKDSSDSCSSTGLRPMAVNNVQPVLKNTVSSVPLVPPVAKAHPMPANLPPANRLPVPPVPAVPPAPVSHLRPNSNVSFMVPVMGGMVPPLYTQRMPPPMYPNFYEYPGPWHFYEPYDRTHGNVNLNFNIPPKNLVVNGRGDCKNACGVRAESEQGCWIKPTIFYDGFWTEQKVKKWVAEQVEKQFPDDTHKSPDSASKS